MRRLLVAVAAVFLLVTASPAQVVRETQLPKNVSDTITDAFQAAYNLDHDESVTLARRAVQMAPDEPAAHRTLAAMLWVQLLYKRGTVSIDHFLGGFSRSDVQMPKPPADVDAEFKREVDRSVALAEARVARAPADVQANFDLGAAHALKATYTASIEGKVGAAFSSAKRAFDQQEKVLEQDPARTDAGLVVGIYRYLVASFNWPTRFVAYMAGFGGDKDKAIKLLEAAAAHPSTRVDARTALMLIFSREGRHTDVERLARELRPLAPRNRLLFLEEGSAAIRAGRAGAAEEVITRGLAVFAKDPRPKVPGERALWMYKRGLARVNLNHLPDASVDLHEALAAEPPGWIRGRVHLELGKIDDLGGRRAGALEHYKTAKSACEASRDPNCTAEAGRLIRRPFKFDKPGTH
jgi:tetratricopeptide (TPR) repeat protein